MDHLQSLFTFQQKQTLGVILKLLQGLIVWTSDFGDFRVNYYCHLPVSGINPSTLKY